MLGDDSKKLPVVPFCEYKRANNSVPNSPNSSSLLSITFPNFKTVTSRTQEIDMTPRTINNVVAVIVDNVQHSTPVFASDDQYFIKMPILESDLESEIAHSQDAEVHANSEPNINIVEIKTENANFSESAEISENDPVVDNDNQASYAPNFGAQTKFVEMSEPAPISGCAANNIDNNVQGCSLEVIEASEDRVEIPGRTMTMEDCNYRVQQEVQGDHVDINELPAACPSVQNLTINNVRSTSSRRFTQAEQPGIWQPIPAISQNDVMNTVRPFRYTVNRRRAAANYRYMYPRCPRLYPLQQFPPFLPPPPQPTPILEPGPEVGLRNFKTGLINAWLLDNASEDTRKGPSYLAQFLMTTPFRYDGPDMV